eukprot:scaffold10190_cov294-Chaetoceros_neogracile.AAC.1
MDFGSSAARLRKDHEKLRSLNRNRNTSRTLASNDATSKAKKVEEYRKQVNEKKKQEDLKQKKMKAHVQNGFDHVERKLGVIRQLGSQGRYEGGGAIWLRARQRSIRSLLRHHYGVCFRRPPRPSAPFIFVDDPAWDGGAAGVGGAGSSRPGSGTSASNARG